MQRPRSNQTSTTSTTAAFFAGLFLNESDESESDRECSSAKKDDDVRLRYTAARLVSPDDTGVAAMLRRAERRLPARCSAKG